MISELRKRKCAPIVAQRVDPSCFTPVVNNLAVTPSDMHKLTERGIPINSTNNEQFIDGTLNCTFDVPIERCRGVEAVDVWLAQCDARKKFRDAHIADVNTYGD